MRSTVRLSDVHLDEAIAVVGVACRFPGAAGPRAFRGLLTGGRQAVTGVPADRLFAGDPAAGPAGRYGAFIDGADLFDADLFGFSPREAAETDPRQRLMLELGREVLEDARIPADALRSTSTGVFVGASGDDYALLRQTRGGPPAHHTMTGLHRTMIANRLSYTLGAHGPSAVLDTGQSSSLAAVVQAVQSLRAGACGAAIAGGVHLNLAPHAAAAEAGFGGLSPDGRCFAFDRRANGYVRGEGGGAVLLKRLADALADGDRVQALILGGAVTGDGATPAPAFPGREGQERALRAACADARIAPGRLDHVELHGTGTPVGDPVEAAALGAVHGAARPAGRPLPVGSVKTNIGHLSAAAGIAGLIKTVLGLSSRELFPSLNFTAPPEEIPLERLGLRVQTETAPWPSGGHPVAGVSSFGMGGTDCHVVLAAAPPTAQPQASPGTPSKAPRTTTSGTPPGEQPGTPPEGLGAAPSAAPPGGRSGAPPSAPPRIPPGTSPEAPSAAPPGGPRTAPPTGRRLCWIVSAASAEALRAQCARLRAHVEADPAADPADIAHSLATTRERLPYRIHLYGRGREELLRGLAAAERGDGPTGAVRTGPDRPGTAEPPDPGPIPGARTVDLPGYAFQRSRHWFTERAGADAAPPAAPNAPVPGSPGTAAPAASVPADPAAPASTAPDAPAPSAPPGAGAGDARPAPRLSAGGALDLVRGHAAEVLGHSGPDRVRAERTFRDLGFDSVMGTELRTRLERATGRRLPAGLVYDHPTPALLARALERGPEADRGAAEAPPAPGGPAEPVAITAMACRFPGGADGPEALWRLLEEGADTVSGFPVDRGWEGGSGGVRLGGFLYGAADFDAGFFGISPREAAAMDPQQRILLELAWEAAERAGIAPDRLAGTRTGVFIGATASGYGGPGPFRRDGHEGYLMTGAAPSVASGRIAYLLGLGGPALTVDTACSSSLVAVDRAVRSLQRGECSAALAGGVCVLATPEMFTEFGAQGGLAPDGRCKPFAAAADGTAWAEGAGLLLLERLSDARRSGHPVLAVIRGSAVNSDGASNGLTAPSGPAQQRVIRAALADAGLEPGEVDAVEAHGTGTRLGDPIEAGALSAVYGADRDRPLRVGALKSVIGHTQAAAGVAGVIKTVLALGHGVLPASRNLDEPTPEVDWARSGLALLPAAEPWTRGERPRRAGVSSFGISGTNAHLILEEAPEEPVRAAPPAARRPAGHGPSGASAERPLAQGSPGEADREDSAARPSTEERAGGVPSGSPAVRPPSPGSAAEADRGGPDPVARLTGGEAEEERSGAASAEGRTPAARGRSDASAGRPSGQGPAAADRDEPGPLLPFVLSAASPEALRDQALRLTDHLERDEGTPIAEVARALATTRAVLEHRAVVLAADRPALLTGLAGVAEGGTRVFGAPGSGAEPPGPAGRGRGAPAPPPAADPDGPVFVFPGQGTQWPGMAAELMRGSEAFRRTAAECAEALRPHVGWDPLAVLRGDPGAAPLSRVDVVQPVLWAVMVALAETWRSYGVRPSAVVGHSQGEIAAACVSGALTIADGAAVAALRSAAITGIAGSGAMAAVALGEAETAERIAALGGDVHVAAVNGPSSTVVSGAPEAVRALVERCQAEGADARRVDVDYASHSPHVEAVRERVLTALAGVAPAEPAVPFHSTLLGGPLGGTPLDAGYWYANLRSTVRFAPVVQALAEAGHRTFIEVSPHPALTAAVTAAIGRAGAEGTATGTLRRGAGGPERMAEALGEALAHGGLGLDGASGPLLAAAARAFTEGAPVDWRGRFADRPGAGPPAALPTYPFQRRRYWLDAPAAPAVPDTAEDDPALWSAVEAGDAGRAAAELGVDRAELAPVLPALAERRRRRRADAEADRLRYRETWVRVPAPDRPRLTGTWLLVAGGDGGTGALAAAAARRMAACGARVVPVAAPPGADRAALTAALSAAAAPGEPATGVLSLLACADAEPLGPDTPSVPRPLAETAALVQALGDAGVGAPLWCATRGAVAAVPEDAVTDPRRAAVCGLARVAAQEHPARWGGTVDLPPEPGERDLGLLCAALGAPGGEDQTAVRAHGLLARRLERAPLGGAPARHRIRPGTVLVTGGTGALGAQVARRLAAEPEPPHLLLAGRRGMAAPGAPALVEELHRAGAEVTVAACDAADHGALRGLLDSVPADRPLRAVLHAAAALDDAPVHALTPARMERALRAKATAALHLHELTLDADLDAFVLFSSAAGLVGVAGQGNYAPGNAVLDALARHRRALGLEATSVAWGAWAGPGMAAEAAGDRLARHGLPGMDPGTAAEALLRAVRNRDTAVVLARFDWSRFPAAFTAVRPGTLLDRIPEAVPDPAAGAAPAAPAAGEDRGRALLDLVRRETAAVLGHASADGVADGRAFKEQGLDSVTALELRNRLAAVLRLKLPASAAFDHPTPAALAAHLEAATGPKGPAGPAEPTAEERLDTALAQVEAALSAAGPAALERSGAVGRIRALLGGEEHGRPSGDAEVDDATPEELLALIDAELGGA
ncbi:SDR family NAD(P)-dependent oxidoreductase [Nocardiopsis sp. CNT-189]|uniref:SDR family NAD(P)-dependent oxidoreductase n=1 Tax=Nocardiopsis oceanisediminis TaxID=2816862 RepID=UPI003B2CE224